MARQDINVDPIYGELNTTNNLTNKMIYQFNLLGDVEGEDNDNYCFAEIVLPSNFKSRYKNDKNIHVNIPHIPIFKELKVCLRIDEGTGHMEYIINSTNNKIWYPVYREDKIEIRISEYRQINENCNFNFIIQEGYLLLFSGEETDLIIKASKKQNQAFLLKASAGSVYQYPTIGVGLINYLHSNFENTGLAQKLQNEFINDNMIIEEAAMNSSTGELSLKVIEKNG